MLKARWRKVRRDLFYHRGRTMLVILSICMGVLSVGLILRVRSALVQEMNLAYLATNPGSGEIHSDGVDPRNLDSIRRIRGVADAEGRAVVDARLQTGANSFVPMTLVMVPDYEAMRLHTIEPQLGAWPPPERGILLERSSLDLAGVVYLEEGPVSGLTVVSRYGTRRTLPLAGVVADLEERPHFLDGEVVGYVNRETFLWLGETDALNRLYIEVDGDRYDTVTIQDVLFRVEDRIERTGVTVRRVDIPTPGQHPLVQTVDALSILLTTTGLIALLIAAFLIFNTISSILTRQMVQIGVMKSMGADTGQLMGIYLTMVLMLGIVGSALAVPLSEWVSRLVTGRITDMLYMEITLSRPLLWVILVQLTLGIAIPLAAAYLPIYRAVRMTVLQAIGRQSRPGMAMLESGRRAETPWARLRRLSQSERLSVRNLFRRRGRLILSVLSLTLGGALFIALITVRSSVRYSLDQAADYWRYDVEVSLVNLERVAKIEQQTATVEGLTGVEHWIVLPSRRQRPDGSESDLIRIDALPPDSAALEIIVENGRWLRPGDAEEIVVNTLFLQSEPDLAVGDDVLMNVNGRVANWTIAGVVSSRMDDPVVYANVDYMRRILNKIDGTNHLKLTTAESRPSFREGVRTEVEALFDRRSIEIEHSATILQKKGEIQTRFDTLILLLSMMVLVVVVISVVILTGTMGMNQLERMPETGVLRSIGADRDNLVQIIVFEGILSTLLSWLIAGLLAWPLSIYLADALGRALIRTPLTYRYSFGGVVIWFVVAVVVGILSGLLPALRSSRLTVREILAFK